MISGGDSFYIHPENIRNIGNRLINSEWPGQEHVGSKHRGRQFSIHRAQITRHILTDSLVPHIRRFRYASKGLAVAPMRFIDPADDWTDALIEVTKRARDVGKSVAMHTHFNHANEFSWITEAAAQKLFAAGVTVRNQTVLLKGVNDNVQAMSTLIRKLANNNVTPVNSLSHHTFFCSFFGRAMFAERSSCIPVLRLHLRSDREGRALPHAASDTAGSRVPDSRHYRRLQHAAIHRRPARRRRQAPRLKLRVL